VIAGSGAELVILQEAVDPAGVARIAELAAMPAFGSRAGASLAYLSRLPVASADWHKPRVSRHAFLEVVPEGSAFRVFGLHLSAVHSAWTERRRTIELGSLLASIASHQHGPHVLVGDFNTLAPGEYLDATKLPNRLRALVWLSGGRIRFRTIQRILDAGYVDCFRRLAGKDPGLTFPTWSPHVRLDFAFVPAPYAETVRECRVLRPDNANEASDHFPLILAAELGITPPSRDR
jgi:endonuclease/exonuclease/phosphatase family metal-dependent hydrolase